MSNENLLRDDLVIPAGTTIKFNGIAFSLVSDAQVQGLKSNMDIANNYANTPKTGGDLNPS